MQKTIEKGLKENHSFFLHEKKDKAYQNNEKKITWFNKRSFPYTDSSKTENKLQKTNIQNVE